MRAVSDDRASTLRASVVLPRRSAHPGRRLLLRGLAALIAAGAVTALAVVALSPYAEREPLVALVNGAAGVLLVVVALVLVLRGVRLSGALFASAGVSWLLSWLISYDRGVLALVGGVSNYVFYLFVGWGILVHLTGRLPDRLARAWLGAAIVILPASQPILTALSRPEWQGFSADVWWPHLVEDRGLYRVASVILLALAGVLSVVFLVLAVRMARRLRGYERLLLTPALLAGAVIGPLVSIIWAPTLFSTSLPVLEDVLARQGVVVVVFSIALSSVEVRRAALALRGVRVMLLRPQTPTPAAVRDGLRIVLEDPSLELEFWMERDGVYVDCDGRVRPAWAHSGRVPLASPVLTAEGRRLSRVEGAPWLAHHLDLVHMSIRLAGSVLHAAAAQLALRRERDLLAASDAELRRAQARVQAADAAARERLAERLHDDALQTLSGVAHELAATRNRSSDGPTRAALRQVHAHLLAGIDAARRTMEDLRDDDLELGLEPALRMRAQMAAIPVDLDVPAELELPAATESALYGAVREGLANAQRHSGAHRIAITVRVEDGYVVGQVVDDGRGGARVGTRGGLATKADRVAALGGTLDVEPAPAGGTALEVRLRASSDR